MLNIESYEVVGTSFWWSTHGMRNPKNSWNRNDTTRDGVVGENDKKLAAQLARGGSVHAKHRRFIIVYADINAPLYWHKEMDTYRFGVEKVSCSTMHKIASKIFEPIDFSIDHLAPYAMAIMNTVIAGLNVARTTFLQTKDKDDWWQMIQLLPSSYNQKRTYMFSYESLAHIYNDRRHHKLDEWHVVCDWIETLPYFKEFILGELNEDTEQKA